MKSKIFAFLLFVLSVLTFSAHAQQLKVATGSPKGTYSIMFKELNSKCSTEITLLETPTNGSNDNIDLLVGNQVNAAFTQTDVLYFRARTEDLGNVKTLIALHPEEVHIIAMSKPLVEGGTLGFGAKTITFNTINDLSGRPVGAAGGSYTTAQVVRLQSEIPFNVVQFDSNDIMMKALESGAIRAAIMVGGAPMPAVSALTSAYKLLSIPEAIQKKLQGVYRPARVSYSKMNAAGVSTVATDALFVTREYKTPKMVDSLGRFRKCALEKVEELKETTGTHPKWQAVDTNNKGKWSYYSLP